MDADSSRDHEIQICCQLPVRKLNIDLPVVIMQLCLLDPSLFHAVIPLNFSKNTKILRGYTSLDEPNIGAGPIRLHDMVSRLPGLQTIV
jgi:hypothetical protein